MTKVLVLNIAKKSEKVSPILNYPYQYCIRKVSPILVPINEYQLRPGRQRQVWFIPLVDELCAGKTVRSLENALKKAEHLYSALHGIQTTLKWSGMDHTVLPAVNTMPAFTSYAFTRWRLHQLRWWTSNCSSLLIYRPRKDERPSWLILSGRFTHTVVTRQLKVERRTGSVRRPKTGVRPTVLRNQPYLSYHACHTWAP